MALVDMKRSKSEQKKDSETLASPGISGDDYPYGLTVHLDHHSLGKLGMDKLPNVGEKLHLHAHAHVKEVREEHRDGGKKHRHVTLELRKMAVGKREADNEEHSEHAAKGAKAEMDKVLPAANAADEQNDAGDDERDQ